MKQVIILLLFVTGCLTASAQHPYWQQQVNYDIYVSLNDVSNTLTGYVKMSYTNQSPDTLRFIWIHLWPNAYKNDRTAFSDQQLENGSTDFYFSNSNQRGYINQLDFKVNGNPAKTTDHPQHQDIAKLVLPQPLLPGATARIETPFFVKLPFNFSRGGHVGQSYQITQWYPRPAVYDHKGWHEMPYLDQGEFYGEFGSFNVQITLPKDYKLASTGKLQTGSNTSDGKTNSFTYQQDNVHDFAWFADKRFVVKSDTLALPSGRVIDVYSYSLPVKQNDIWKESISYLKKSILTRGQWLGEYPYNTVTAVEAPLAFSGGMEYPTITAIGKLETATELEGILEHEIGHIWNYGILANDERLHPWMDEGINTFYDNRYDDLRKNRFFGVKSKQAKKTLANRLPDDMQEVVLRSLIAEKLDQPIATRSEDFTGYNYFMMAYYKTGQWMKQIEDYLGRTLFDSCMHRFYEQWKFKHPYPEDLKATLQQVSGRNMDSLFALLHTTGSWDKPIKKDLRFTTLFNIRDAHKHNYIAITPVPGANFYDKFMIGAAIHNYSLPMSRLQFFAMPMYGTGSKSFNGLGRVSYNWFPKGKVRKVELSLAGSSFNVDDFKDSTGKRNLLRFYKIVPGIKIQFAKKNPRSQLEHYVQARHFYIGETGLRFARDTVRQIDIITYPITTRYVNQVQWVLQNHRVLYPWRAALQLEQGEGFARAAFTGNYFFNYAKGGGLDVRVFAGKFFYLGEKTFVKQFETDRYHLNMTGPRGYEDYTYSNYFIGRNEFEGVTSQQIMIRDGAFKVRTDLLSNKIGKTDNWLASANFVTTIPKAINPLEILPIKIPLRAFLDIGTYADAWQKNATTGRFLYNAGLQVSLLKNTVNIYMPLLYSKVYKDYLVSTIPTKRFARTISFSIDIQNLLQRKLLGQNIY